MPSVVLILGDITEQDADAVVNAASTSLIAGGGVDGAITRAAGAELLRSCHASCLRVADELGATTVAFPAISTGIYGYPADEAAPIALNAVRTSVTRVAEVRFVLFDAATLTVFEEALGS